MLLTPKMLNSFDGRFDIGKAVAIWSSKYARRPRGRFMRLRTVLTVATIFLAFFTVAVWRAPENH